MTTTHPSPILDILRDQIGHQFELHADEDSCELTTPFLYPDNTPITLFVTDHGDGTIELSDRGQASDFAFVSGVGTGTVNNRLRRVQRRFLLHIDGDELIVRTSEPDLGESVTSLISAVQDIGYLVYRQPSSVQKSDFRVDVERFLVQQGRAYDRDVTVPGKARARKVDYRVKGDGSRQLDLWVLDATASSAAATRADAIAMSYIDIATSLDHTIQEPSARFAVLVNTSGTAPHGETVSGAMSVLTQYVPYVIPWEHRHQVSELLQAA